ncbi:MAG TPA: T9SS type A sorting domain-containing protein [Chitinophagales bacterium]|nr:T9SS type A sorting domain-containing protein [Chitinophagales bacterium]
MKKIYFTLLLSALTFLKVSAKSDLAIKYDQFENGTVTTADSLLLDFTLSNLSGDDLAIGDTLYLSIRLNSTYYGFDLVGTQTEVVLPINFKVGEKIPLPLAYIDVSQLILLFPEATTLEICLIVWGKGLASVDIATPSFPKDTDPSNNITCVTYNPNVTPILNKTSANFSVNVYPNPAKDVFNVQLPIAGNFQIQLHDMSGRIIRQMNTNQNLTQFSTENLSSGMYFYTVSGEGSFTSGKIFIQ